MQTATTTARQKSPVDSAQIHIILIEPSHPGNIGAAARAMKNMGLSKLVLVNPAVFPSSHADARASHAKDILEQAEVVSDFSNAINNSHLIIGTSARNRSLPWPMVTAASCAEKVYQSLAAADNQIKISIIFGREHSGLTNQELQACHYHLFIPTHPTYNSLNLAAAVQVVCYEIYQTFISKQEPETLSENKTSTKIKKFDWSQKNFGIAWDLPKASHQQVQGLLQHLENMLTDINFFDPANPKMVMQRLKRLLMRVHLDEMEVNLLRGIFATVQAKIQEKNNNVVTQKPKKNLHC